MLNETSFGLGYGHIIPGEGKLIAVTFGATLIKLSLLLE
jgi:hypothetical protein